MKPCRFLLHALFCFAVAVGFASFTSAAEVDLDFTQYSGVWLFDNAANRFEDASGNGNTLTESNGTATFGTPLASNNGFAPWGVFTQPAMATNLNPGPVGDAFNASGPRLNTPGGMYSGGDFTMSFAARTAPNSNQGFGTMLSSQRFQMVYDNGTPNIRNVGTGDFNGTDAMSQEDWHLITLRYDDSANTAELFIQTNTSTLDPTPQSFAADYDPLTIFGFGRDGLSGQGGDDAYAGDAQIDFAIFQDGFLTNEQLQQISDFFADGPPAPPPPLAPEPTSMALFALSTAAMVGWHVRRRRKLAGRS